MSQSDYNVLVRRILYKNYLLVQVALKDINKVIEVFNHLHIVHHERCYRNCLNALPSLEELFHLQRVLINLEFHIQQKLRFSYWRSASSYMLLRDVPPVLSKVYLMVGTINMCMMLHLPIVPTVSCFYNF